MKKYFAVKIKNEKNLKIILKFMRQYGCGFSWSNYSVSNGRWYIYFSARQYLNRIQWGNEQLSEYFGYGGVTKELNIIVPSAKEFKRIIKYIIKYLEVPKEYYEEYYE